MSLFHQALLVFAVGVAFGLLCMAILRDPTSSFPLIAAAVGMGLCVAVLKVVL